jgi:hypothetical protein
MKGWLTAFAVLTLFMLFTTHANACSCIEMSPCAHFEVADAVFSGRVTSIKEEFVETTLLGKLEKVRSSLTARFEIYQVYKGLPTISRTIEVATGGGGGDCGYHFEEGEEYFVMGHSVEGIVATGICSGTRPLDDAADRIELIEALLRDRPETRIFGTIILDPPQFGRKSYEPGSSKPLSGIRVEARGDSGLFFDVSDANGRFRMKNIPQGKYEVRPFLPPTHSGYLGLDLSEQVEIGLPGKCAVEMYLLAQLNGVIRGRLYDSDGRPIGRNTEVSLLSADSAGKSRADIIGGSTWTEEDGTYEFNGLPPGRYIVGVGILRPPNSTSRYSDIYYPNASNLRGAHVLTLGEGQKINDINFRLPPPIPTVPLKGLILDRSGKPVGDVFVQILDVETGHVVDVKEDVADDGTFSFIVPTGRKYRVRAIKYNFPEDGEQSDAITITASEKLTPITLRLVKPFEVGRTP